MLLISLAWAWFFLRPCLSVVWRWTEGDVALVLAFPPSLATHLLQEVSEHPSIFRYPLGVRRKLCIGHVRLAKEYEDDLAAPAVGHNAHGIMYLYS